jgi:translocation and assembly module TamB
MRRLLKIFAWVVGTLALVCVLIGAVVYIGGNSVRGRTAIEKLTYALTSGHVVLSGLAGSFPQQLTLDRLELRDARGVWLTAEKVSVVWSPMALLTLRIDVGTAHAGLVDMERLPESSSKVPSNEPASIPHIDVADVAVDRMKLGHELAGTPAELVLRGHAHLRSVQDMVIDATAHRINGDGNYELHLRFDTKRMDAALTLHEPAGGPLENMLQLPGLGALAATVNLNGPLAAEHLEVSVDAGAFRGRAQGSLNMRVLSADLRFDIDSPAVAPRSDLGWERASVHGRWQGSVNAPVAHAHIDIDRLRLPGGMALATVKGDLSAASGVAELQALIGGLLIPGPAPHLLQDSPLTLSASMRLEQVARPLAFTVSHRLFSLAGSADTAAINGERSATLELKLPDLAPLAGLGGQQVRGSALVKARLKNDGKSTRLSVDANAALVPGTEIWSGPVGDRAGLQLSGVLTDATVRIDSLRLTGRTVSLTANGEVARPAPGASSQSVSSLRASWNLDAPDLRTWSPTLQGTLRASGSLNGPLTAIAGDARLNSTLSVRDSPVGTVSADLKFRGLPAALAGTVEVHGALDGSPLHVDLGLERSPDGALRTMVHRMDWKSVQADGDITIAPAGAQSHGQLRLQVGELADLRHVLGIDVKGSVAGTVALRSDQGRTHAQLHLDARDLGVESLVGNAQLTAEGGTDAVAFKLDLQVPKLQGAAASLSASGSVNLDSRKISLMSAVGNYRGQDVHLLSPAQIALANGVSIDALKLGAQQAVLVLGGEISPALDVNASVRNVQASLVNVFAPGLLAAGLVEAHAHLQGSLASYTGQAELKATGLALSDDAAFGLPPVDIQATARLLGDAADVDARLVAGTQSRLSVVGRAPLAADGAVDLKISGDIDVGMINTLLEARGQHASGEIKIDASIGGTVTKPQIGGTVNLSNGSVRDYGRGVSLTDIDAAIVGGEGALQIKSMTAKAAPGTLSVTGSVGVLQPGVPVDVRIKADHAQPIVSKLITANLNADLHVSGTARERLDIAGKVDLGRTLIGIPNSLPPNVVVLDVRRRGKAAPVVPDKQLVIGLDVDVQGPQEILVSGRGLDAEMGGELHLSGTTDAPLVSGGFDLQRGSYSLAGNKLNFTTGRVSFNGAGLKNKIDPTLDFTAQSTVGSVTATLRITGLADAPRFEFTSSPAQPQDEIMALLLFGAPATQLSAFQLAQVGAMLATLGGVGGSGNLNPLVKIQKSLGLDRLTVGAGTANTATGTENSGASIEAGRYISKRIYIEAKQSTTGTSQLEADVDLTRHLKLQTRLGNGSASSLQGTTPENDPGSSIGLTYQFEY